jgi:lipopolysaccharide heptosyltransferase II
MKILIRLPNWLGDVVMASAFVSSVKQVYPGALIDVIIKKDLLGIAELIAGLNIIYPFSKQDYPGVRGVYKFGRVLRHEKYDLFFNLPASLSSVIMARATGAMQRVGFKNEGGSLLLTNAFKKPVGMHRADEYIYLLEKYARTTVHNREVSLTVERYDRVNKSRVLINFNSEASSRRMPPDKGIAIINSLISAFPNHIFTLVGSPKETGFMEGIIEGVGKKNQIENMVGKTSLAGLCNLMAGSAALISTDSGPAHLANAVGTPVIVLFGAGNENNTAPYNEHNLTVIRSGTLTCEPCLKNECKLYGIPKCMLLIDELQIINVLRLYLPHAER